MAQNSETYPETAPAVDYELISGDTGRKIKIPRRVIPAGSVLLPRWGLYCLVGLSVIGFLAAVMLISAVLVFVR